MKLLLSHGAHPDAKDKGEDNTPLIIAAGKATSCGARLLRVISFAIRETRDANRF